METKLRYTVTAYNGEGDEKEVAAVAYKQDALRIAQRFASVGVTRHGKDGNGCRVVYSHEHNVKDHAAHKFTNIGVKEANKEAAMSHEARGRFY